VRVDQLRLDLGVGLETMTFVELRFIRGIVGRLHRSSAVVRRFGHPLGLAIRSGDSGARVARAFRHDQRCYLVRNGVCAYACCYPLRPQEMLRRTRDARAI
jgi:hypothetical protein